MPVLSRCFCHSVLVQIPKNDTGAIVRGFLVKGYIHRALLADNIQYVSIAHLSLCPNCYMAFFSIKSRSQSALCFGVRLCVEKSS